MSASQYLFHRDLRCQLKFKYPKRFSRPGDLSAGKIPAKAAGVAEFLSLCEVGLPALQLAVKFLELCDHVVKDASNASDFVSSRGGYPMTEITSRQSFGALHQSAERHRDTAGDGQAKEGGEQECQS